MSDPAEAPEANVQESSLQDSNVQGSDIQQTVQEPSFGWSTYAEQLNGRFAMVGFVTLLILELFTHQDFFTWMGLR